MKKLKKEGWFFITLSMIASIIFTQCTKQNDWLDVKFSKSSVVPETVPDLQAIFDNILIFNQSYSTAGLPGSDNANLTDVNYNSSDADDRNLYIWKKEIWLSETSTHWDNSFRNIAFANIALEGIEKAKAAGLEADNVRGEAYFHRALAYYNLTQLFCKTYSTTAATDPGLPIRLNSDVNVLTQRATLAETYQQILADATAATTLLPENQLYVFRPKRAAAYALLAKAMLVMGNYSEAEKYATACIKLSPKLLDFNNTALATPGTTYRFPIYGKDNPEILFYSESNQFRQVVPNTTSKGIVAPELYNSYEANDLRRTLFYAVSGTDAKYRGGYTGRFANFTGLAANEVYLIRAESFARSGNTAAALQDLNQLLRNRYKSGFFIEKATKNADEALVLILNERRKELPFTGNNRWEDLKRLNTETRFQKTIQRTVNGTVYTLLPNDPRYVLPIPTLEVRLSGIIQNQR